MRAVQAAGGTGTRHRGSCRGNRPTFAATAGAGVGIPVNPLLPGAKVRAEVPADLLSGRVRQTEAIDLYPLDRGGEDPRSRSRGGRGDGGAGSDRFPEGAGSAGGI
ncbi:hypothetical protein MYAER_3630 [Microcystis aeruginosa NIES-2549]|uniref:Uncharacterized protein n=1 Tax=Microcystis aeruginosa NIES-2549 TaxID=1641812 RepID=A0A0F6U6N3_MICAE|nr:hypothetical protein MYAER_3630 [Microcystis aeruginosa NIES-2549]AOC54374.1 hypothetical protein amyaer_3675 [Microcystis aeruginosa NIES-2481]